MQVYADMSTTPPPTYIDTVLVDVLNQINYSATAGTAGTNNDISLLSALPYLPLYTPSTNSFSSTNQQIAINAILPSPPPQGETAIYTLSGARVSAATGDTQATYTASIGDAMANIISNPNTIAYDITATNTPPFVANPLFPFAGLSTAASLTPSNLCEAFYQAGSSVFLQMWSAKNATTPVAPINPNLPTGPSFQNVVDITRLVIIAQYVIANVIEVDLSTGQWAQLNQLGITKANIQLGITKANNIQSLEPDTLASDIAGMQQLIANSYQYVLNALQLTEVQSITDTETTNALYAIGLGPWAVMLFVMSFQNPTNTFVTQAYSRIAMYYLAIAAFQKLGNDLVATTNTTAQQSHGANLLALVTSINKLISESVYNIDNTGPIADVLALSVNNNNRASQLAAQGQSLQTRVGIASDLQTTYQLESKNARAQQTTFYAWLVAYLVVLVTSVVLIVADRISVFLAFSVGTLILLVAILIIYWALQWSVRDRVNANY